MSIRISCPNKEKMLPCFPCSCKKCAWFVRETAYNNCFWVLMHVFSKWQFSLEFEEIARLEGLSVEEVEEIYNNAVIKLKNEARKYQDSSKN